MSRGESVGAEQEKHKCTTSEIKLLFFAQQRQTLNNKNPKTNQTYCATVTFEMVKAKVQSNHSSLYSTCLSWLRMKA